MRIVIDLQAAQSPGSRIRGIGRYSLSLAEAMIRNAGDHEVWLAMNHRIAEPIDELRARFEPLVPGERILVWESLPGVASHDPALDARRRTSELLRERFLASLAPDVVHAASVFEGWADDVVTSLPAGSHRAISAATLYDLIPYLRQETYLQDQRVRRWYLDKLRHLFRADLLLAISDSSRNEAIEHLGFDPRRVVNISGACDDIFHVLDARERERVRGSTGSRFGLQGRYVLYTGGFDARKNIDGLIRAFAALPAKVRSGVQLAIVGHGPAAEIERLKQLSAAVGLAGSDVAFTGYVTDEELRGLYNLCELYVFPSFHEGFGLPALEAMACGAPVIGADASSLPEVIGLHEALFDPSRIESISSLMERCLSEPGFAQRLRDHARSRVAEFSWDHSAQLALQAMEQAHATARRRSVPAPETGLVPLVEAMGDQGSFATLRKPVAQALALNEMPVRRHCWYVDVTMLADVDVGTGIQRVVRNILRWLLASPPTGCDVVPVRFVAGAGYLHARAFAARFAGISGEDQEDLPIDPMPGDTLLGLDLIAHLVPDHREYFRWMRDRGVRLWFVVYDLLPVTRPECFPQGGLGVFQNWYAALGELATGIACISRAVADELKAWYDQVQPARRRPLQLGFFHLGADLRADALHAGAGEQAGDDGVPAFLMVGTVEPRKGHAQVLDAFEILWERGGQMRLVIIGKPGWLADDLIARLRSHPFAGDRLVWLEAASDRELMHHYASARALIMASEAEGFGLPLIEAAQHGLPIICRDLPVFREVAGEGAFYFDGRTSEQLAYAVQTWLERAAEGKAPDPAQVRWITWEDSARQLVAVVEGGAHDAWTSGTRYQVDATHPRLGTQNGRLANSRLVPDGSPGYLAYGPYTRLPRGRYRVTAHCEVPPGERSGALLDLVAFETLETLAHVDLSTLEPQGGRITVLLSLHAERDLDAFQVRLFVPEGDRTAFVGCALEHDVVPDPDPRETPISEKESI